MDAADSAPSPVIEQNERRQADADLERRIDDAHQKMLAAQTVDCARSWAHEMARLINQRSEEQISRMEKAQGLR